MAALELLTGPRNANFTTSLVGLMLSLLLILVLRYWREVAKILSIYPPLTGLPDQLVTGSSADHSDAAGDVVQLTYGAVAAYCTNVGRGGVAPLKNSASRPLMVAMGYPAFTSV